MMVLGASRSHMIMITMMMMVGAVHFVSFFRFVLVWNPAMMKGGENRISIVRRSRRKCSPVIIPVIVIVVVMDVVVVVASVAVVLFKTDLPMLLSAHTLCGKGVARSSPHSTFWQGNLFFVDVVVVDVGIVDSYVGIFWHAAHSWSLMPSKYWVNFFVFLLDITAWGKCIAIAIAVDIAVDIAFAIAGCGSLSAIPDTAVGLMLLAVARNGRLFVSFWCT